MESRKWKAIGVLVLVVFLVSCAGQASPTAEIPVSISPFTSATRTPRPTKTPYPTWSPMPTFTATPPEICDKAALVNFLQKNKIEAIAIISPESTPNPLARYCDYKVSPDGLWVEFRDVDDLHGDSLELIQINGEKQWRITSDEIYEKPNFENLLYVSHWDVNGSYAYISSGYSLDGGYVIWLGFNEMEKDLFQLNLNSGQVLKVFDDLHRVAFSPNGLYLAYFSYVKNYVGDIEFENLNLNIFDTVKGVIVSRYPISAKYESAGGIVWSPDSQKIIFVGAVDAWLDAPNVQSSLFLVDLQKYTIQKLIDGQKELIIPYAWNESNRILVCRTIPSDIPCENNSYYFDLRGRIFSSQVTLTPAP